ncbi:MAG: gluconate 2-dehydrogenase subunit 3 family protein [Bryobacteraceae bacterium]
MVENKTQSNEPQSAGVSRRHIFHILGSVPAMAAVTAGSALAQTHEHAAASSAPTSPFARKVFDDHQWRTVHVLCDLIIPADDTGPSATQAGVPEFMDDWLNFRTQQDGNDNLTAQVFGGLVWLDRESQKLSGKNFADAAVDQQKQILDRIAWPGKAAEADHAWVAFFNTFRNLTTSGFLSSKAGVAYLPYLGNTVVTHWDGCDPKVWAIIEERLKNGYKGLGGEVKPWTA